MTNYHTLLAQRLKNLFKLSPDLNSEQTKFKILLQTSCNTDDEAKKDEIYTCDINNNNTFIASGGKSKILIIQELNSGKEK